MAQIKAATNALQFIGRFDNDGSRSSGMDPRMLDFSSDDHFSSENNNGDNILLIFYIISNSYHSNSWQNWHFGVKNR